MYPQGSPAHLLYPWGGTHELYPQGAPGHGSFPWRPATPASCPHLGSGWPSLHK